MINKTISIIVKRLCGLENDEFCDIYIYGLELAISSFLNFMISFTISCLFNAVSAFLIYFIFLLLLKFNIRGYHCKTLVGCLCLTAFLTLIFCLFYYLNKNNFFVTIITALSFITSVKIMFCLEDVRYKVIIVMLLYICLNYIGLIVLSIFTFASIVVLLTKENKNEKIYN